MPYHKNLEVFLSGKCHKQGIQLLHCHLNVILQDTFVVRHLVLQNTKDINVTNDIKISGQMNSNVIEK